MTKYKCERPCIWLGQYWNKGAIYEGDKVPPHHFVNCEPAENKVNNSKAKSKPAAKPEVKAESADTGSDKS